MDRATWEHVGRYALTLAGIRHFSAAEIAPVGRLSDGETGTALIAPTVDVLRNAIELARLLDRLRDRVGRPVKVTSWYRDPAYNKAVGGVWNSMHVTGGAADVQVRGISPRDVARAIYGDEWSEQTGVGVYSTFTHIDIRGRLGRAAPARW